MKEDTGFKPTVLPSGCLRCGRPQHARRLGRAILLSAFSLLTVAAGGPAVAAEIYSNFRINDPDTPYAPLTNLAVIDTSTDVAVSTELTAAPGETGQNLDFVKSFEQSAIAVRRDGSYFMRSSLNNNLIDGIIGEYLTFGTPDGQVRILGAQAGGIIADSTQAMPDAILSSNYAIGAASNAFAVNPEGDLIVAAPGEIWRVNPDGEYSLLATPTISGIPLAAQYGPDLELYVLATALGSTGNSRIYRFDGSAYVDVFPELPDLPFSNDFSIDAAGNFYFNDYGTNSISKIDEDGQLSSYLDLSLSSSKRVRSFFVDEEGGVTHLNLETGGLNANHSIDHQDTDGTQTQHVFYNFVGGVGDDFSADRIPFGHKVEFIPEPSSLVLAGCCAVSLGVLAIGRARRKRRGYKM